MPFLLLLSTEGAGVSGAVSTKWQWNLAYLYTVIFLIFRWKCTAHLITPRVTFKWSLMMAITHHPPAHVTTMTVPRALPTVSPALLTLPLMNSQRVCILSCFYKKPSKPPRFLCDNFPVFCQCSVTCAPFSYFSCFFHFSYPRAE